LDGDNFNYEQVGQGREEQEDDHPIRYQLDILQDHHVCIGEYGFLLLHHNGVDYIDE
tara:strand:- start:355 stop:525 length:171 start_codon:yes stop_codon:yes gene_type:complete